LTTVHVVTSEKAMIILMANVKNASVKYFTEAYT